MKYLLSAPEYVNYAKLGFPLMKAYNTLKPLKGHKNIDIPNAKKYFERVINGELQVCINHISLNYY